MGLGLSSNINKVSEGYPQYRTKTSCTFTASDSDKIEVANHADLQVNSSDFSVSGWVKATVDASSTDNEDGYAIMQAGLFGTSGNGNGRGFYVFYYDGGGDHEKFQFFTNNSSSNSTNITGDDVSHNQWYHVVATYDTSSTTGRLYVNGSEVSAGANTSMAAPEQYTGTVSIGGSSTNFINAKQSEIVFWKGVVLSPAQITALYNNGRPRHGLACERSSVKGWWKLNSDDDTGSGNVIDSSGNGRNGTSSGLASSDFDTTDVPGG
tara:strand:- start:162 stop:956 length:795 start_codon:yes stop_codon:yes gene_type:complete